MSSRFNLHNIQNVPDRAADIRSQLDVRRKLLSESAKNKRRIKLRSYADPEYTPPLPPPPPPPPPESGTYLTSSGGHIFRPDGTSTYYRPGGPE